MTNNKFFNVKSMAVGSIIAALYVALGLTFGFISFGPHQVRVAELLIILPLFTPAAIPGLYIGCLITNAVGVSTGMSPLGWWDIVFGPLASLAAAICTHYIGKSIRNKDGKIRAIVTVFATLPAVVFNAIVVGFMLSLVFTDNTLFWFISSVAIGQLIAATVGGSLLAFGIMATKTDKFLSFQK